MTKVDFEIKTGIVVTLNKQARYEESEKSCRQFLNELPEDADPEFRSTFLRLLSESLWRRGFANEALPYGEESLALSRRSHAKLQAESMMNFGIILLKKLDFTGALELYRQAIPLYREHGDNEGVLSAYFYMGTAYGRSAQYSKALEYFKKALEISEEIGSSDGIARTLSNIGNIYMFINDYPHSLEYFRKAQSMLEERGNKEGTAKVIGNIGHIYFHLGELDTALENYKQALAVNEELGQKDSMANNIDSMGVVYRKQENYQQAMEFSKRALDINTELDRKYGIISSLKNIAFLYSVKDYLEYDPEKAEQTYLEAIALAEEADTKLDLYDLYHEFSMMLKQLGRWEDALGYFEKFYALETKVKSEEVERQALRFAVERDVAVMKREQEIFQIKNNELAKLNKILEEKNIELANVNKEKNQFLGIAAHDLKNPLSVVMMLASMLTYEAESLKPDEIKDISDDIRKSSKDMLELIVNLLDYNKIEQGTMFPDPEIFSIAECVTAITEGYTISAAAKNISIINQLNDAEILASKAMLIQVLDNLISNAIKFSPLGKHICIQTHIGETTVRIVIQDEGPGLTEDDKTKLFKQFSKLSARPTADEHSTGLGLSIVNRLVEGMKGSIRCESSPGEGAAFIVELPYRIDTV